MLKNTGDFLRKNLLSLITLAIVAGLLLSYFKVYIPKNQDEVNASKFRVLQQMSVNISNKLSAYNNYKAIVDTFIIHDKKISKLFAIRNFQLYDTSYAEMRRMVATLNKTNKLISLELKSFNDVLNEKDLLTILWQCHSNSLSDLYLSKLLEKSKRGYKAAVQQKRKDNLIGASLGDIVDDTIWYQYNFGSAKDTNLSTDRAYALLLSWKWEDFIKDLLRTDFKAYVIFDEGQIAYSSNKSLGLDNGLQDSVVTHLINTALKLNLNLHNINSIDSLYSQKYPSFISSAIHDIDIGGVDYKLFFFPINTDNTKEFLCGLLPASEYNSQIRQVSDDTAFSISIFILLFILLLPFLKLLFMAGVEKLGAWDLIKAIGSLMVGCVVLTTFNLFKYQNTNFNSLNIHKCKSINDTVSIRFSREIDTACKYLCKADSTIKNNKEFDNCSIYYNTDEACVKCIKSGMPECSALTPDIQKVFHPNKNYLMYLWLSDSGKEKEVWAKTPQDTIFSGIGDYSKRKYFADIKSEIKNYTYSGNIFCIEPVISWTTGDFRTVLSTKSHSNKGTVACLSMGLPRNAVNVFVPQDYGYCIFDKTGHVLYSSDTTRALNENIFKECSDSSIIIAATHSRTEEEFNSEYHNEQCTFVIQPVGITPFFIISYLKNSISNARLEHTTSYACACIMVLFIFIILILLLRHMLRKKPNDYSIFHIQLDWLWPAECKRTNYIKISKFLISVIIVTLFYLYFIPKYCYSAKQYTAFALYIYIIEILTTTYYLFKHYTEGSIHAGSPENGTAVSLLQWIIKRMLLSIFSLKSVYGKNLIIKATVFISITLISTSYLISPILPLWIFLYQVIIMVIMLLCELTNKSQLNIRENEKKEPPKNKSLLVLKKLKNNYYNKPSIASLSSLIILLSILITSIIPTINFIEYGYDQTSLRQLKDAQLYYLENYNASKLPPNNFGDIIGESKSGFTLPIDTLYQDIIYNLTQLTSTSFNNTLFLGKDSSKDRNLIYHHNSPLGSTNNDSLTIISKDPVISISSSIWEFNPYKRSWSNLLFLFTFILTIGLIYCFIKFLVQRFFGSGIIKIRVRDNTDTYFKEVLTKRKYIFLNGIPGGGKYKMIATALNPTGIKYPQPYLDVNFLDIPDISDKPESITIDFLTKTFNINIGILVKKDKVVIRHFEHNFKDPYTNRVKLKLIETLLTKGVDIIIISYIDPMYFLQSASKFRTSISEKELKDLKADMDRWARILGNFYNFNYCTQNNLLPIKECDAKLENASLINDECRIGTFLPTLKDDLFFELQRNNIKTRDEIIDNIQVNAHLYYQSIWTSLTKEEQYLVYNLAREGLLNTKNSQMINVLYLKGLLREYRGGRISLFNESFKNFILLEINHEEIAIMDKGIAEKGRWSNLRTPILIIIVALVVLLASSKQESISNIISYLTMFLTGLSLLQRIIGGISGLGIKSVTST